MTKQQAALVAALGQQARGVAAQHADHEDANEVEEASELELLRAIVDAVRPAVPALVGRVAVSRISTAEGTTEEDVGWVGARLVGEGAVVRSGVWGGRDLYLRADGTFAVLVYSGQTGHLGQGGWRAAVYELTAAKVCREWDVRDVISGLAQLLSGVAGGNLGKKTKEIRRRADMLRAVALLVREIAG